MARNHFFFGLVAVLLLVSATADAQRGIDVERYSPVLDAQGFVGIQATRTPGPGRYNFGFNLNYSIEPLKIQGGQGVIDHRVGGNFLFQIGIGGRWAVGVDLPLVLYQDATADPLMDAGGPIASGRQWLSWVHVADAVRAIRFVAEQGVEGAVNVTAPEAVRNVEFARTAGSVMHRPALLRTPGFVLRAVLGEQAVLVCEGQNVAPAVLRERGFEFAYPTLRAALEEILN